MVSTYVRLRQEAIDRLGGRCVTCGHPDSRVLQIDHKFGGGADERRDYPNGVSYLRHILANLNSDRYQLLCASCNWLKRSTNFECVKLNLEVIDDLTALASEYEPA